MMLSKLTLALGLAGLSSALNGTANAPALPPALNGTANTPALPPALNGTANARGRCGAPNPSDAQMQAAAEFTENEGDMAGGAFRAGTVTVNTYFHVVASSDRVEDGYLSVSLTSLPSPQLQLPLHPPPRRKRKRVT